jgi:uncharacterized membrane protein YeaQ/YmgE (transglycosylase-associated protein family)
MDLLSWLLFGLLAGATAKLIMPGKDPGGCLVTIAIGITGSVIGGALGEYVFGYRRVQGFNLRSLGIAILGSIVLLALYRLLLVRRHRR